jgi:pimeloyl-ACP methyl ester carboxylesterase
LTAPGGGVQAVVDEADGELLSANGLVPQTRILTEQDLGFDFRLPVFFVQGAIDFTTPTVAARNYFNLISAPQKAFVTIPSGGHFSVFIHCDAFLNRVVGLLRPLQ